MNWNFKIDKKQIEAYSKIIGFGCSFIVLFNQAFKSNRFISQELSFLIAIIGIIFLSISINLKVQRKDERNLSFFKKNSPLIMGIIMSVLLSIFWITNNYINF